MESTERERSSGRCLAEEAHSLRQSARHQMWSMESTERERSSGRCLAKMVVSRHVEVRGDWYPHRYRLVGDGGREMAVWNLKMKIGDLVVLSEDGDGPLNEHKVGLLRAKLVALKAEFVEIASRRAIGVRPWTAWSAERGRRR